MALTASITTVPGGTSSSRSSALRPWQSLEPPGWPGSAPMFAVGKRRQTVDAGFGAKDHAAAVTAVAAIGSAERDVLFAAEADATVSAVAGIDLDFHAIDEHGKGGVRDEKRETRDDSVAIFQEHTNAVIVERALLLYAPRWNSVLMLRAPFLLIAGAVVGLFGLRLLFSAPTSAVAMRQLQAEAVRQDYADWGYWGARPSKYTGWGNHSNRLIPVYTFGIDLASVRGEHSPYRSRERLVHLYGYLPTETLNPQAEYFDETDIYRIQQAAVAQGKKRIILVIFDGMDWQTTQAAAVFKSGSVKYREGRGSGLHFLDYRGAPTDFGYFVTSPRNVGTEVDVDAQALINPGGKKRGGYSWRRGGDTPWAAETDPRYVISKSRDCPHAYADSASAGTSLTTGVKTYDDAINVDSEGRQLETIGRQLQRRGFAVGAVTSVPISHATPATAYANNVFRDDYQDLARFARVAECVASRTAAAGARRVDRRRVA